MPTPVVEERDPFLADQDFDVPLASNSPIHPAALNQPEPTEDGEFTPPVPASAEPQPQPAADEPEIIEVDGGTITITHDQKGWHGALELEEGGGKEVFHGKTQKELMANVLAGKLKATAQIRKLNKKLKLGTPVDAPVPIQTQPAKIQAKTLDANDIFEIKTALEADPDKAFDIRFQKKFGMTESQFVALVHDIQAKADRGVEAYEELTVEGVSKEFLERNKDRYHPYEENGANIMAWLCKHKLRRAITKNDNFGTISGELLAKGLYTVENLEEALEDLEDSGLLTPPPDEHQEEPAQDPPTPPAKPSGERNVPTQSTRIASQTRRPRGGLGIRSSSVSTHIPDEPTAPSVEDLDNLSNEQINELFSNVRRTKIQNRR